MRPHLGLAAAALAACASRTALPLPPLAVELRVAEQGPTRHVVQVLGDPLAGRDAPGPTPSETVALAGGATVTCTRDALMADVRFDAPASWTPPASASCPSVGVTVSFAREQGLDPLMAVTLVSGEDYRHSGMHGIELPPWLQLPDQEVQGALVGLTCAVEHGTLSVANETQRSPYGRGGRCSFASEQADGVVLVFLGPDPATRGARR